MASSKELKLRSPFKKLIIKFFDIFGYELKRKNNFNDRWSNFLAELNDADNLIIAKNYLGAAFLPEFNFNGIGNLEPGQGYQVKINESGVLNFLSNDNSYKFSKIKVTNNILSHFQSAINTGSNMTISVPSYAWGESPSIGDEISAYNSTGKLVGSAIYTEPLSVISVWGDDLTTEKIDGMENGEIISFKL